MFVNGFANISLKNWVYYMVWLFQACRLRMVFPKPFSNDKRAGISMESPQNPMILWGEEEQGSGRSFRRKAETEVNGLCDDDTQEDAVLLFGTQ